MWPAELHLVVASHAARAAPCALAPSAGFAASAGARASQRAAQRQARSVQVRRERPLRGVACSPAGGMRLLLQEDSARPLRFAFFRFSDELTPSTIRARPSRCAPARSTSCVHSAPAQQTSRVCHAANSRRLKRARFLVSERARARFGGRAAPVAAYV